MMKIKLYQVNMDRDKNRVAFDSLERLEKFQGTAVPKSEIYDRVFAGEVDANNLEGVYTIFNTKHPVGYAGRSMSVSDVLEVVSSDGKDITPGFYFCDSFGFKAVPFEPEKAVIPETMTVLYLAPGEKARVLEIDTSLQSMQHLVQGYIEAFYPFTEEVCIVCNEEGKINGMALNRAIYEENPEANMSYSELTAPGKEMIDIIAGPCFICDCSGEEFASLSDEQIARYMKMFELPKQFMKVNGKFVAIPFDPDKKIDNIISQAKQKTQESAPDKVPEQER